MALSGTETLSPARGLVVDKTTGAVVTTTTVAGARWFNGFLRDADGRLVVVSG